MTETSRTETIPAWRGVCESIHLNALGIWAGVLLMVGAVAAVTFPMMADLDVRIPAYEQYDAEHHRIAAGQVMNRAFAVADWVGLGCLLIAAVTLALVLLHGRSRTRRVSPGLVIRVAALACVAILTLFQSFVFRPSLNSSFERLWEAARTGDNAQAAETRKRLAPMHAKASFMLASQFSLVLIAGLAGGYDASSLRSSRTEPEGQV